MGQAIDLPDPLDSASPLNGASLERDSAPGTSGAEADDILSQLAGDEIDRLLAEADIEAIDEPSAEPTVSKRSPAATCQAGLPAPVDPPVSVNALNTVLAAASIAVPAEASPPSPFAARADAPTIDATALSATPPTGEHTAIAPSSFVENTPMNDGARSGRVDEPLALPAPAEADLAPLATGADPDVASLPIVLRPLAWLNAPFDALPDTAREILGKIAILTLFNAVAVLVYVLVFRH